MSIWAEGKLAHFHKGVVFLCGIFYMYKEPAKLSIDDVAFLKDMETNCYR